MCRGVLAPAAERSAQPLRQFVARYGGGGLASGREYQRIFDHLRQYLLLSDVPDSREQHLWNSDRELWRDQLVATWKDLDHGRRSLMAYTKFFRDQYRLVVELRKSAAPGSAQ